MINIPLDQLHGTEFPMRDDVPVGNLRTALVEKGFDTDKPLKVFRREAGGYEVFDGNRRLKILRELHPGLLRRVLPLRGVPCVVCELPYAAGAIT